MLYQPFYPSPYLVSIDANNSNTFSCYINAEGGTYVSKYIIKINDLLGNQIYIYNDIVASSSYSGDILNMVVPRGSGMVNGMDYVWNVTLIEDNPDIWVTYGTIQEGGNTTTQLYLRSSNLIEIASEISTYIKLNNQTSKITAYNSETGLATLETPLTSVPSVGTPYNIYSNGLTSNDIYFLARSKANLTYSIPSTINTKSYNFQATYTQNEGVNWKYFEWILYDRIGEVLQDSGKIYSGIVEYEFDGMINGNTYGVSMKIETEYGEIATIPITYFQVAYDVITIDYEVNVTPLCDTNANLVSWQSFLTNQGYSIGEGSPPYYNLVKNQPYIGGSSVQINTNSKVYWYVGSERYKYNVPYNSTIYINWQGAEGYEGDLFEMEGSPVELTYFSSIPPVTCEVGDSYYNRNLNLIYNAIETNIWSVIGEEPKEGIIYTLITTGQNYILEDGILVKTTQIVPTYKVSYNNGVFYYTIQNGDTSVSSSVEAVHISNTWLLAELNATNQANYLWLDESSWTDDLYWTESTFSQTYPNTHWFKIVLLPTTIQIVVNNIQ